MQRLEIREAKLEDASAIAKVHVETWQHAYRGQVPGSYLESLSVEARTKSWKKGLSKLTPKSETYVAEINDKIVGFCSVGPSRDKDAIPTTGELYAIYVDPNSKSKGIGSTLTKKGLEFLKKQGFTDVTLWVLISNTVGRQFYENRGWRAEDKTKEVAKGFKFKEVRYKIDLSRF